MQQKLVLRGGKIVLPDAVVQGDLVVENGKITELSSCAATDGCRVVDVSGRVLLPGGIDSHVHVTEPSPNSGREDWTTASKSAAAGGVTTIVQMPVNDPPVSNRANFIRTRDIAAKKSCVDFALWGALIPSSVAHLKELYELGCVAFKGFMSHGCEFFPRIDDVNLFRAMELAHGFGGIVGLHAEHADLAELGAGRLEAEGCTDYARYDEARPWWAEAEAIERALLLAQVTGAEVYFAHLCAAQGVELVRSAKRRGQRVIAETCPHYLLFTREACREKGSFAKCNPPLRSEENREQLWNAIFDGTLDVLGSDHGIYRDGEPHPDESFWQAPAGFPGIDVALTAFYSEAVVKRGLPLPRAAALAAGNAAKIFGLRGKGALLPGMDADIVVMDFHRDWHYDAAKSFSRVKFTHGIYQDYLLHCRVDAAYVRGTLVYDGENITVEPGYGAFIARDNKERGII